MQSYSFLFMHKWESSYALGWSALLGETSEQSHRARHWCRYPHKLTPYRLIPGTGGRETATPAMVTARQAAAAARQTQIATSVARVSFWLPCLRRHALCCFSGSPMVARNNHGAISTHERLLTGKLLRLSPGRHRSTNPFPPTWPDWQVGDIGLNGSVLNRNWAVAMSRRRVPAGNRSCQAETAEVHGLASSISVCRLPLRGLVRLS